MYISVGLTLLGRHVYRQQQRARSGFFVNRSLLSCCVFVMWRANVRRRTTRWPKSQSY